MPEEFGYYTVRTKVLGYRSGGSSSYAVIPDNRVPECEPNSPFGVCCHWGDYWYKPMAGVVAKRAGIAWIRDGHHQDTTNPGGSYQAIKENKLCCMSITGYCPEKEQDVLKPDGTCDFSDFLGRRSAYARTVANEIDFYDMTNEPVFQWSKVFGGKKDRWIEIFSKHFTPQYEAALQKADPGARILWEGYPEQMETFIQSGGAQSVFAISPHTYWFKAEPEDRGELTGGYARAIEIMKKNDLKWPVNDLDRFRLAQALFWAAGDEYDEAGNAMVAFFALAAKQEGLAQKHLKNCGPQADAVLAGFETGAPAAGASAAVSANGTAANTR